MSSEEEYRKAVIKIAGLMPEFIDEMKLRARSHRPNAEWKLLSSYATNPRVRV